MLGPKRPAPDPADRPHPEDLEVLLSQTVPLPVGCKADAVWQFGKYIFRADFDSANLESVEQGVSANEYLLRTQRDCEGTLNERATRTWFYFSIRGHSLNELLIFNILNLNKQGRLYSQDYRPVFWHASQAEWQPLRFKVTYRREGDDFQLRFCHRFESEEETLFAFAFPFSYQQTQDMLDHLDDQLPYSLYGTTPSERTAAEEAPAAGGACPGSASASASPAAGPANGRSSPPSSATSTSAAARGPCPAAGATAPSCSRSRPSGPGSGACSPHDDALYYRRQLLTRSVGGRRVEVITVTDCSGATGEHEPPLAGVFSHDPGPPAAVFRGGKTVFFVSSRVHPGETPASHMFNGMLAFLLRRTDPRAAALRRRFVFKLVPLVNPDGVAVGNYRTDTLGQNLNRFYNGVPDEKSQPSVFAIKSLLMHYAQQGLLEYYLDLHAHANKKGVFIYGNTLEDGEAHFTSLLYSKLISMNSPVFDFIGCNYTEKNMCRPDRDGASKEGAGRVALYRETGLTHLYTVEANYNIARTLNVVAPASGEHGGRASPPCNKRFPTKFTVGTFQSVGRAMLVAALDMEATNPWSRLPHSEHRNLDGVRGWLHTVLRATPETRAAHLPPLGDAAVEAMRGMVVAGALRGSPSLAYGGASRGRRSSGRYSLDSPASSVGCHSSAGGLTGGSGASTSTSAVAFGRSVGRLPPQPLIRRTSASLPVISAAAASQGPHGATGIGHRTSGPGAARRPGGAPAGLLDRAATGEHLARSTSLPVRNNSAGNGVSNGNPYRAQQSGGGAGGGCAGRAVGVSETGCGGRLEGPLENGHGHGPGHGHELPSEDGPSEDDGDDDESLGRLEDVPKAASSPSSRPSSASARFRSMESPPVRATTSLAYKGSVVYCSLNKMTEFKIPLEDRPASRPGQHPSANGGAYGNGAYGGSTSPIGVKPSPLVRRGSVPNGTGEHTGGRRPASAGSGQRSPTSAAMAGVPSTPKSAVSGSARGGADSGGGGQLAGGLTPSRWQAHARTAQAAVDGLHLATERAGGGSAGGLAAPPPERRYR